jgi:hypothetical protein
MSPVGSIVGNVSASGKAAGSRYKKKVIENFKKHYGLPLTPESHRTAVRDLEEWCIARNVSEE